MPVVSKLKQIADAKRAESLLKNRYREGINEYDKNNNDTKSDGDNRGREPISPQIPNTIDTTTGTKIDILKRIELMQGNNFRPDNPYEIIE